MTKEQLSQDYAKKLVEEMGEVIARNMRIFQMGGLDVQDHIEALIDTCLTLLIVSMAQFAIDKESFRQVTKIYAPVLFAKFTGLAQATYDDPKGYDRFHKAFKK